MTRAERQNGFVLLPVVLAIVLIAIIAFLLNNQSAINVDSAAGEAEARQADAIAAAGLAHATWAAQNSACAGDMVMTTVPFGPGNYTATVDAAATSTTSYTLNPDRDTFVRGSSPDTNFGTENGIRLGPERRGLLHFDLSAIPAGSRVVTATLWLYFSTNDPGDAIDIHPVTAAWTETGATWNNSATAFDSQLFGVIPPQPAPNAWVPVNLTALAQSWVNDAGANHGLMLLAESLSIESKFSSREHFTAAQHPYLQLTTADGAVTPISISATGTLSVPGDDITRALTRTNMPAYQPATNFALQPGPEGKDGWVNASNPSDNFGTTGEMVVSGGANPKYFLIEFDLPVIPSGSRILSAKLEMHLNWLGSEDPAAEFSVYRMTKAWTEGSGDYWDPGDGANWNTSNGSTTWSWTSNHDASSTVDTTRVNPTFTGWHSWDIKQLVQQWTSGQQPNYGLLVTGNANAVNAWFHSSDWGAAGEHPRLTVTYACECGDPCLAPRGSGSVLMVAGDDITLAPGDAYKKTLMESWGYTVDPLADDAAQAVFDADFSIHDVVYVSSTSDPVKVGTKLTAAPIGIVNEQGLLNSNLGFAGGSAWPIGPTINVTDSSHYITKIFPTGPLPIYRDGMGGLAVGGTPAPGLQGLADWGGATGLAALETGAIDSNGNPAATRRVLLPFGPEGSVDWTRVNGNGRLLLQRALEWGMGAAAPTQLLFVAAGTPLTAQEQLRIALIGSWGYRVNVIDDNAGPVDFDAAVAANDIAYIPSTASDTALGTKLLNATIGIVNENMPLAQVFGFDDSGYIVKSRDQIRVVDNSHYITTPLAQGYITVFSSLQTVYLANLGTAQDGEAQILADVYNIGAETNNKPGLMTFAPGDALETGGTSAGRRVQLPWGDATFDVAALNADGLAIMQRAIEWAEGAGAAGDGGLRVLYVVTDPAALTAQETARQTLMEGWGFIVTLIDDDATQADFDTATVTMGVAYVSQEILETSLGTKLVGTTIGVVNEDPDLHSVFGFSSARYLATDNAPLKTEGAHYITSPFAGGNVTLFSSNQPVGAAVGTLPSGLLTIGSWTSGTLSSLGGLLTLESGATIAGGGTAAGRRVQLPWGGQDGVSVADITALTADGQSILQRSLLWAAGAETGGGGSGGETDYYLDEFPDYTCDGADEYLGSSGSLDWSALPWVEVGDDGRACGADFQVMDDPDIDDPTGNRLRLSNKNRSIYRQVDLSGYTSASLTLDYRRAAMGNKAAFDVMVSGDGGSTWSVLETVNSGTDTGYVSVNYDISAYIAADTRIQFSVNKKFSGAAYIDNVRIGLSP